MVILFNTSLRKKDFEKKMAYLLLSFAVNVCDYFLLLLHTIVKKGINIDERCC